MKAGFVATEEVAQEHNADSAEVQIDFAATDGSKKGAYEARIKACGEVMSAFNSAKYLEL